MLPQHFYELSARLVGFRDQLVAFNTNALKLYTVRYKYLVDNSPKGLDCTYARLAQRAAEEDGEYDKTLVQLRELRTQLEQVIQEMQSVRRTRE